MGTARAPVTASGICPAWTMRVSKPKRRGSVSLVTGYKGKPFVAQCKEILGLIHPFCFRQGPHSVAWEGNGPGHHRGGLQGENHEGGTRGEGRRAPA